MLGGATARLDPRIQAIERTRKQQNLTHQELCRRASLSLPHWYSLRRGEWGPSRQTIDKLKAALHGQAAGTPREDVLRGLFQLALAVLKLAGGKDLGAGRVRRLAIYLVTVELCIENADLARAIGTSRQNVQQVRNLIEDLRDREPETDRLLEYCGQLMRAKAP